MSYTVGVFIGSLSKDSINRRLARALTRLAPPELKLVEVPIGNLPLYNRDFDADYPPAGRTFKDAVASVDALLFVTPEHNRSIPGVLQNAIDWGSRPWGTNSFAKKPAAVTGASSGNISTALAQHHLRGVLAYLDAPAMAQPEAYIHFTPGLMDDDGNVADASTETFLRNWLHEFHIFITMVAGAQRITL